MTFALPVEQTAAPPVREAGYSLMEILVALGLLGLTLTLVAGNGVQMLNRWTEQSEFRSVRRQIAQLRYEAYFQRRPIEWLPESVAPVALEPGWSARVAAPVYFLPTGVCLGGDVQIYAPTGRQETVRLTAPDCSGLSAPAG